MLEVLTFPKAFFKVSAAATIAANCVPEGWEIWDEQIEAKVFNAVIKVSNWVFKVLPNTTFSVASLLPKYTLDDSNIISPGVSKFIDK